jgi:hypothetical protein
VAARAWQEGLSIEDMTRRRNAAIPLGRPNDARRVEQTKRQAPHAPSATRLRLGAIAD